MRDRAIRTRQVGSVVGRVCAGPSLLVSEPIRSSDYGGLQVSMHSVRG
jgi:hypothetical protein